MTSELIKLEARRIQRTGKSTLVVSLPRKWVNRVGLRKGDLVWISEREDGSLEIRPKLPEDTDKSVELDLTKSENWKNDLLACYLSGFSRIRVVSRKRIPPEIREEIKGISEKLIGLEIVEEDSNSVLMHDLLDLSELPPKKALKRAYVIATSMNEDSITSLEEGDEKLAKDVIKRDDRVDRLYFLVVRQLRKAITDSSFSSKVGITPLECLDFRVVAEHVERIGDYSEGLARLSIKYGKFPSEVISVGKATVEIHQEAMNGFLKRSYSKAERARQKYTEIMSKIKEIDLREMSVREAVTLISMIGETGKDIADIVTPW